MLWFFYHPKWLRSYMETRPPPARPMWHSNSPRTYLRQQLVSSHIAEVMALAHWVLLMSANVPTSAIFAVDLLPKSDGKFRLILQGHPLAGYELPRPFKIELLSQEGGYLFAGYTHGGILDISILT
jgi:hypothetical protein